MEGSINQILLQCKESNKEKMKLNKKNEPITEKIHKSNLLDRLNPQLKSFIGGMFFFVINK